MKTPETGDPELRIRIPVSPAVKTKVSFRNGVSVVRLSAFLHSNVALEIGSSKAAQKLVEALQQSRADLIAAENAKAARRPREPKRKKAR